MAEKHSSHDMSGKIEFDKEYECCRINGALYAPFLQCVAPNVPHPWSNSHLPRENKDQRPESSEPRGSGRKRRGLDKSTIICIEDVLFRLLKSQQEQVMQYILEMREAESGLTTYDMLHPSIENGKHKVKTKDYEFIDQVLIPVTEEVNPLVDNKYKLSLNERLEGPWTIEFRRRSEEDKSDKLDKFYNHKKIDKTFRSLNEAAAFIFYGVTY